ncbi:MAG: class I SAM-dependent methyltransferase [Bacteroidota bacterium]
MDKQIEYYQKRALEYDRVYQKPERQDDLTKLNSHLQKQFPNKRIIEIACGTGYWTERIAPNCTSILATDVNLEVLEIAQQRSYPENKVDFLQKDLRKLDIPTPPFDALFGGFIWSHIKREELVDFLSICLDQVGSNGEISFIDNQYVEGSSTPISRTDHHNNTYQIRKLSSGATYEILKNFPAKLELEAIAKQKNLSVEWVSFKYYWFAKFKKSL